MKKTFSLFSVAMITLLFTFTACQKEDISTHTNNDTDIVGSGSSASASSDDEVDQWPAAIDEYLDNNYPTLMIESVSLEDDDNDDLGYYEVDLSDGTELYFDLDGNFLFAETEDDNNNDDDDDDNYGNGGSSITSYIAGNYPCLMILAYNPSDAILGDSMVINYSFEELEDLIETLYGEDPCEDFPYDSIGNPGNWWGNGDFPLDSLPGWGNSDDWEWGNDDDDDGDDDDDFPNDTIIGEGWDNAPWDSIPGWGNGGNNGSNSGMNWDSVWNNGMWDSIPPGWNNNEVDNDELFYSCEEALEYIAENHPDIDLSNVDCTQVEENFFIPTGLLENIGTDQLIILIQLYFGG